MGSICYEYDHINPYSKGGETTTDNCQILSTKINRLKKDMVNINFQELKKKAGYGQLTDNDMDIIEKSIFGNVFGVDTGFYVDKAN